MPLDPRTPVLVGAATVQQCEEDPGAALEPLELMIAALERAAEDAGSRGLLPRADSIRVPRGFWDYGDPGRLIAARLGATGVRTQVAEIGILQTTLLGDAGRAIAAGEADVVLLCGGEARHRSQRAARLGVAAYATPQGGVEADSVLRPDADILSQGEIRAGLGTPVRQYAMIENALRHAEGLSLEQHRRQVAELWSAMSQVAAGNPDAWSRKAVDADAIAGPGAGNRMLAFPYRKLHTSQWNVDQAAGLILCSLEAARRAGVQEERLVFPLAVADSNWMVPLSARRALEQSPGFAHAGRRALWRAGLEPDQLGHLELYSCFPAAVRVQARELGLPLDPAPTVTGGMRFAGGPLNHFVLQATARMVRVLRSDPGSTALVTAVSGILTKQGVALLASRPPERPFAFDDVGAETARDTDRVEVVEEATGPARIASYTILYDGDAPSRAILLCDLPDGQRTLASSDDAVLARTLTEVEGCGLAVRLDDDGRPVLA